MAATWENIALLARDKASEALTVLKEQGEEAAVDFLKASYEPGEATLVSTRGNPWKEQDHVYEADGYVLFYDLDVPYIGLVCRVV